MQDSLFDSVKFGKRLKKLIEKNKLHQKEVAEATGIDESNFSKMINGTYNSNININTVLSLANYFNCSIDYLITGDGKEQSDIININNEKQLLNACISLINTNYFTLKVQTIPFGKDITYLNCNNDEFANVLQTLKKYTDDKNKLNQSVYYSLIENLSNGLDKKINY